MADFTIPDVSLRPSFKLNSAATTNATVVKPGPGSINRITASNVNAAIRYLKLYDKATAPTVGTDVPVLTLAIPLTGYINLNMNEGPLQFAAGIGIALTTGATDADTTAVAANEVKVTIGYV